MPAPKHAIVLSKATGLAARAAGMAHAATHPDMRKALTTIELIARESRWWLQEYPDADTVRSIDEGLVVQAQILDTLEDKLRVSADAKP